MKTWQQLSRPEGGGYNSLTLLASLTSVPTSSTAISGTENWEKYDAIYFVIKMHFSDKDDVSSFTNLILTKNVVIGDRYSVLRQPSLGNSWEANVLCWFYDDRIEMLKKVNNYDVLSVNIYGVDF